MNWTELLFEAVEIDDVDLVQKFILQGADAQTQVDKYEILSATVLAPRRKQGINIEIVSLLLAAGANPNERTEESSTALYWATVKDENELVRLLINAGATVEAQPRLS